MTDGGLKSVIADLKAMRYRTTDIARELCVTRQHVNRVLREFEMNERPLRSINDLPIDLRDRVINARKQALHSSIGTVSATRSM